MTFQKKVLLISVVVIGRNEGDRLIRCLQSVKDMRCQEFQIEIIYVDTASTDGSPQRAEELGVKVVTIQPDRPCAAAGRNAGWRIARGQLILFLDGDTILDRNFVAQVLPLCIDPTIAVIWGRRREINPNASIYNRVLDLDWMAEPGLSEFCGGDALIRRSVLEEVEGYDDSLIAGEEPDMCRRMRGNGYQILHVVLPMTSHDLALTRLSQYWRRAVRTGYAYAEVSRRYRHTNLPLWSRESKQNFIRGSVISLLGPIGGLVSILLLSWIPLLGTSLVYMALFIRTAMKSTWKCSNLRTAFFYGIHSHMQQVPILLGQLTYFKHRHMGSRQLLIEYKEISS